MNTPTNHDRKQYENPNLVTLDSIPEGTTVFLRKNNRPVKFVGVDRSAMYCRRAFLSWVDKVNGLKVTRRWSVDMDDFSLEPIPGLPDYEG